jgi:hypothetical protein
MTKTKTMTMTGKIRYMPPPLVVKPIIICSPFWGPFFIQKSGLKNGKKIPV